MNPTNNSSQDELEHLIDYIVSLATEYTTKHDFVSLEKHAEFVANNVEPRIKALITSEKRKSEVEGRIDEVKRFEIDGNVYITNKYKDDRLAELQKDTETITGHSTDNYSLHKEGGR